MLPYSIKEGLAGLKRARFSTVASTSAMAVALILIGLFTFVTYQAGQVSSWLKQRVGEIEFFMEDAEAEVARSLGERAGAMPGVAEARYISREEAQQIFREEFGEEADVFFDDEFLPASVKVRVEPGYANPDSLRVLADEFRSWNRVSEVVFNQPLLIKVQNNLRLITTLGLSLGILVVLASVFLVANTIRLTIYARRLMIRTMKLVGATDSFVRRPFIIEGVVEGVLASFVAIGVVWGLVSLMGRLVPQISGMATGTALLLAAGLVILGALLGWIGSALAVRRFLNSISLH